MKQHMVYGYSGEGATGTYTGLRIRIHLLKYSFHIRIYCEPLKSDSSLRTPDPAGVVSRTLYLAAFGLKLRKYFLYARTRHIRRPRDALTTIRTHPPIPPRVDLSSQRLIHTTTHHPYDPMTAHLEIHVPRSFRGNGQSRETIALNL